jgi:regulator of sirC expression with transglutaminase-like and TPR domain
VYGGEVRLQTEYLRRASPQGHPGAAAGNLKGIYLNARDDGEGAGAIERILLMRPGAPEELRDRGLLLARTGRGAEAADDLRRYLDAVPQAPDAERVRMLLRELSG